LAGWRVGGVAGVAGVWRGVSGDHSRRLCPCKTRALETTETLHDRVARTVTRQARSVHATLHSVPHRCPPGPPRRSYVSSYVCMCACCVRACRCVVCTVCAVCAVCADESLRTRVCRRVRARVVCGLVCAPLRVSLCVSRRVSCVGAPRGLARACGWLRSPAPLHRRVKSRGLPGARVREVAGSLFWARLLRG
jgi:hypothetical protein